MPATHAAPDIVTEYGAAREGAALLRLDRGVLAATGPQRQKFLHDMLSNDVASLAPGQGRLASLMDVKGHLLALMRVLMADHAVLLELPAERLAKVKETLLFYKVGAPVRFEERPTAVLAVIGPAAARALAAPELPNEAHLARDLGGVPVRVARASDLPAGGFVGGWCRSRARRSTCCASRTAGPGTARTSPRRTCSTKPACCASTTRRARAATSGRKWSRGWRGAAAT
jgi:folate-binding Fe-S cluster repair protein YgfZ